MGSRSNEIGMKKTLVFYKGCTSNEELIELDSDFYLFLSLKSIFPFEIQWHIYLVKESGKSSGLKTKKYNISNVENTRMRMCIMETKIYVWFFSK